MCLKLNLEVDLTSKPPTLGILGAMSLLDEMSQYGFNEQDLELVEKYLQRWKTGKRSERTPLAHKVYLKMQSLDKTMSKSTIKKKKQVSCFPRRLPSSFDTKWKFAGNLLFLPQVWTDSASSRKVPLYQEMDLPDDTCRNLPGSNSHRYKRTCR